MSAEHVAASPLVATSAPGAAPPLHVECLTSPRDLDARAGEWHALAERVADSLPFPTYEWAAAWWQHLRRVTGPLRDRLQLFVVRDQSGAAVAIAPMMHTDFRVGGVRVARVLQPIGTDPNITEVRGMLVAPEREAEVLAALARWIVARGQQSWIQWCGIRAGGALDSLRPLAPFVTKETPAFLLALPRSWDEFKASFPRNLRESLRKCYNSLARESHEWTFRVVEQPDELPAAVDRLIALHGMRAARTDTVQHRDCFSQPEAVRFLHDVTARFARRRQVRVFQLVIGGEVVATRLGFLFGDRLYLYYSGYDPAWGRFSVMTTTVAEALRWAIANGVGTANLSTGPDESKLRWRPTRVEYVDAVTLGRSPYGWLVYRLLHGSTRDRLKRLFGRG